MARGRYRVLNDEPRAERKKIAQKRWRDKNTDRTNAYRLEYNAANRERVREYCREYYRANAQHIRERQRKFYRRAVARLKAWAADSPFSDTS
eukprot:jgi/Tetstr1/423708/TSEL_014342.t1